MFGSVMNVRPKDQVIIAVNVIGIKRQASMIGFVERYGRMLIDLTPKYPEIHFEMLIYQRDLLKLRIQEGIYHDYMVDYYCEEELIEYPNIKLGFDRETMRNKLFHGSDTERNLIMASFGYSEYGMCDTIKQILKKYRRPVLTDSNRKFVIGIRKGIMTRDFKPWKHGKYIGNNSKFLDDGTEFLFFHIYEIEGDKNK